ncbi:L-lactate dehydrogenase [Nostoc sphaeroides CCNUC1]|uniref:L-lactate dehydrogenase n=1 Tax=Nostoc sphaeroides CCNUC1 TaxID=2653204 RepID=A0A5P8WDH9_9NOSO|nr:L-lactate dehydrogenase [Nostoc sphaeroides CCNUC1]
MKGLPSAAPSSPLKMIIIIDGIVYFLEVPNYLSKNHAYLNLSSSECEALT